MSMFGWCLDGHHADCPQRLSGGVYLEPKQEPHHYGSRVCSCICHAADYSEHA